MAIMDGKIELSKEGMIKAWDDLKAWSVDLYHRIISYFQGLDLFQSIAWSAIGLGFCLVIASVVLFVI